MLVCVLGQHTMAIACPSVEATGRGLSRVLADPITGPRGQGVTSSGLTHSPTTPCPHQHGGGHEDKDTLVMCVTWPRLAVPPEPVFLDLPFVYPNCGSLYILLGPAQGGALTRPLGD